MSKNRYRKCRYDTDTDISISAIYRRHFQYIDLPLVCIPLLADLSSHKTVRAPGLISTAALVFDKLVVEGEQAATTESLSVMTRTLQACQPSRNGRDRPGTDPRCPVSRARLIFSRKCENWPLGMDGCSLMSVLYFVLCLSVTHDLTWLECNVTD